MFERNRVDNSSVETVAVEITLNDERVVTGRAALPASRAVHKLLDGPDGFLYVEQFSGEGTFIPKSTIRALNLIKPMRVQALYTQVSDASAFDPYRVLGISKAASPDEIKSAYHKLTKLYHPDVYANVSLPPEVATYLDARAKQINIAYRVLK